MTSPLVVVRAVTAWQLRAEVEKAEKGMQW
jgi:hypothetical protein